MTLRRTLQPTWWIAEFILGVFVIFAGLALPRTWSIATFVCGVLLIGRSCRGVRRAMRRGAR